MDRKDVEQIYYINREIKLLEKELERLRKRSPVKAVVIDGMPKEKQKSDVVGNAAVKAADYEAEIEELSQKAEAKAAEIMQFIRSIDDSLIRQIVFLRCIKLCGWERIAAEVGGNNTKHSVKKTYYRFFSNK